VLNIAANNGNIETLPDNKTRNR